MSEKIIEQSAILSDDQMQDTKAVKYVVNALRKDLWQEFDTNIQVDKWYKFKLVAKVSKNTPMPDTSKITFNINYNRIPDYNIAICHTTEEEILRVEKSFWKRVKNAFKYIFKGGKN